MNKPRENYLGVRGWVWGGRYRLERYLYILHRVTGLGLLLYFSLHLYVMTVVRLQGEEVYEAFMKFFKSPLFQIGEYLVMAAFIYHGLNGLRLIFQELGFLLGRPTVPVYPYRDSLRKKRPLVLTMMSLVVILVIVTFYSFFIGD